MRITIIGDGSAGKRHAGHLATRGHEVVMIGPQDEMVYSTAYVIASPPEYHEDHLYRTHQEQAHVLCEGPCTYLPPPHSAAVRQMASNYRFLPQMQNFKKRLTNPIVAHLWFNHDLRKWRKDWDYKKSCYYWSGHDLINVHEVDIAFYLFGPPERISIEKLYTGLSRACDGFQMLIRHKTGVLTTISSSWHSQHYRRGVYVVQQDGTVEEMSWKTPDDDASINASYEALIDHWLDHIERGDPLVEPSLEDGYRAYQALQGRVV